MTTSIICIRLNTIPSPSLASNDLCRRIKALTFENASSIGLRSGEYGGRNSIRISNRLSAIVGSKKKKKADEIDQLAPGSRCHGGYVHCPLQEH